MYIRFLKLCTILPSNVCLLQSSQQEKENESLKSRVTFLEERVGNELYFATYSTLILLLLQIVPLSIPRADKGQ